MRRALFVAAAVAAAVTIFVATGDRSTRAADHTDAPGSTAAPALDIADLFAWMSSDANYLNLVMTVNPLQPDTATFDTNGQYVFHVNSSAGYGMAQTETQIIVQFNSATDAEVWVGDDMYFRGDPSDAASPLSPDSNDVMVFAGARDDPFFFNLEGFSAAAETVRGAWDSLTKDADGCPAIDEATADALRAALQSDPGKNGTNDLAGASVSALVIQIDKTLVNGGGDTLGVWASTHTRP